MFSMLSLGRILISDLVVANLLMYSLPGMILLYLAMPFLHQRCFWMRSCMLMQIDLLYVTGFGKTDHIVTIDIL